MKNLTKFYCLILLLSMSACAIGSGINSKIFSDSEKKFPQVTGIDLEGEMRDLPKSFDKKNNIVVVAFKREQQANVNGWIKFVDELYAQNSGLENNLGFFEVPLIYEVNPLYRSFINNGMRRGIPDAKARKRTITVYTDRDYFFSSMKMSEEKIYLLLLDNSGNIELKIEGDATPQNQAELQKKLKKILKK